MNLGKISSEDLQLLLNLNPYLEKEFSEARDLLMEKKDKIFAADSVSPAWCHWYELPPRHHLCSILAAFDEGEMLKTIASSPNQIQALLEVTEKFQRDLDEDDEELTEDEAEAWRKQLGLILGWSFSAMKSMRCLMIFGVYLNDLIALVRQGGKEGDEALFRAVKIDVTVMACPSVIRRVSQATLEGDQTFFVKLRKAMTGKLTKREGRNYQNMRLVLQVLLELKAPKLNERELYQLFVEELKLVARERAGLSGNVANNLRQFAYQFMKQKELLAKTA